MLPNTTLPNEDVHAKALRQSLAFKTFALWVQAALPTFEVPGTTGRLDRLPCPRSNSKQSCRRPLQKSCDRNAVSKARWVHIGDAEMLTRWQVQSSQEARASPFLNTPGPFTLGCCQAARDLSNRQLADVAMMLQYCVSVDGIRTILYVLEVYNSTSSLLQPSWLESSLSRAEEAPMSCDQWRHCHEVECCARDHIGFMKLIGTNMEAEWKRRGRMTSHGIAPHSGTWQHAKAAKATRASLKNNVLRHWQRIDRVLQKNALAKSCQFSKLPNLSLAMLAASAASSFAFRRPAPWLLGLPWQVSMA